jgi:membrane fusion protein (multidrug efflux system)
VDDVRQPEPVSRQDTPDNPPRRGKTAAFLVLGLVLAGLAGFGVISWLGSLNSESTDDAFVDGHVSQVAAQIGGRVQAILVRDNQLVSAGQTLLTIDPRDMQVRVDQSVAGLAQARAQLAQATATLASAVPISARPRPMCRWHKRICSRRSATWRATAPSIRAP